MPVRCPITGSWNCEGCGREKMCFRYVYEALLDWGLPPEIAWDLAQEWRYSAEVDTDEAAS